jgi:hypothetical protein
MHKFLSRYAPYPKEERKKGGNTVPLLQQQLPDVDFHKAVAGLGHAFQGVLPRCVDRRSG